MEAEEVGADGWRHQGAVAPEEVDERDRLDRGHAQLAEDLDDLGVKDGERSSLSGKFIGEVERGKKSISIDSLYRVSAALAVALAQLTDVRPGPRVVVPSAEADKIVALVSGKHRPSEVRRAYEVLSTMLGGDGSGRQRLPRGAGRRRS